MLLQLYDTIKNKYKTSDKFLETLIYDYYIGEEPFSEEIIQEQVEYIALLDKFMKEENKGLMDLELPEFAILEAIQQLCHPILIEYLWKIKPEKIYYKDPSIFSKMNRICNIKTGEVYLIPAIKDAMKWTYANIIYINRLLNRKEISIKNKLIFLDKYAEIFDIEYEKISYD